MSLNATSIAQGSGDQPETIDENDRIIAYTQSLREKAVVSVMMNDGGVPKDKDDRTFFASMLDGMSKTALAGKKIKADAQQAKSQTALTMAIVAATQASSSARPPRRRNPAAQLVDDKAIVVVPGQTDRGTFPVLTSTISGS